MNAHPEPIHPGIYPEPPRQRRWLRTALIAAVTLIILAVLVFVSPQGRALAQEVLRFFSRTEENVLPAKSQPAAQIATPGTPTPDPSSILDVHQTVGEVEKLVGFKVSQPAWLPENLSLVGASLQTDHQIVRIFYRDFETNGLVLVQEPYGRIEDCDLCGKVGADARVEPVQIGNVYGEYVEGTWKLTANGTVWESDPFIKRIRWQDHQIAFELLFMGPPDALTMKDMIAIAQSIK